MSGPASTTEQDAAEQRERWKVSEDAYGLTPVHKILGLSLRILEAGRAEISYNGAREAQNRRGNLSGGTIAQMIDSAIVHCCRSMLTEADSTVTLEMKINFLRAGSPGAGVVATGSIQHFGRSTCVGLARVENAEGEVLALGTGTVSIRRGAHP